MKLENARDAYEALSGKASDIVRQMSLAGVALIWVFRSTASTDPAITLGPRLLRAAFYVVIAMALDFLQYLVGTLIWSVYFRYKEMTGTVESEEFLAPSYLNWPTWALFYLKSAAMLIAYVQFIIPFLASRLGVHLTYGWL